MRTPGPNVDLRPDHWAIVRSALRRHVPDRKVLVFGSRATWTAKDYSDLDIVIMGEEPLSLHAASALDEALGESNLPFKVDVVDWARIDEEFRRIIRRHGLVVQESGRGSEGPGSGRMRQTVYGRVASDYSEEPLRDLCVPRCGIQTGPFGSQLHKRDYVATGTPIVTVEHLGNNRLIHKNLLRVSDRDRERLSRYRMESRDIVFSRVGSVDRRALVRQEEEGWLFSGRCLRVRVDSAKINPVFLSYFFGTSGFRQYINSIAVGATMPSLNTQLLSDVVIPHPPLPEQRTIAHILGTLDDKIELNRRMNETLDAMAQVLFKSWFVDFDPVRAKLEGRDTGWPQDIADLFPDRLMDSEMGEIPEGWTVFRLDQLTDHHTKSTSPARSPRLEYEHFSIPAYDAGQRPVIEPGTGIRSNKTVVLKDAVLLSKLNPRIPRVWVPADSTGRPQICSTEFLVFAPRPPANRSLLFTLFTDQRFRALLESFVTGTSKSHQRVPPKALKAHEVLAGSPRIFAVFGEVIGGMLAPILKNRSEAATLAALRDTLLPKLISGAIRVSDAEKLVGARP